MGCERISNEEKRNPRKTTARLLPDSTKNPLFPRGFSFPYFPSTFLHSRRLKSPAMSTTPARCTVNRVRPALKRLLAAIDRATEAQREVEAARAALDRAAAQSQLQAVGTGDGEEAVNA